MRVSTNQRFTYYYFNNEKFVREKDIAKKLGTDVRITQVMVNAIWKDYTNTSDVELTSDEHILIAKGDNMQVRTNM